VKAVIAVRTYHPVASQWIFWPSWPVWRFGQRCPELIGFRDIEDVQWRESL